MSHKKLIKKEYSPIELYNLFDYTKGWISSVIPLNHTRHTYMAKMGIEFYSKGDVVYKATRHIESYQARGGIMMLREYWTIEEFKQSAGANNDN